jgi:hypothetical protein
MNTTYQHKDMNMLQHGENVWLQTQQIISNKNLDLPKWFLDNHSEIINQIYHPDILKTYTIYHDIGKSFCLTIDSEGKRHYPNHAQVSKEKFLEIFPNKKIEAELIGLDMLFHTKNYTEIEALQLPNATLFTLLVVSFAEIFANAEMFNGKNSDSFKIKYKKLDKIGKKLIHRLHKCDVYTYILVRDDLSNQVHKGVQACHAAYEAALKETDHGSIILCKVKSLEQLKNAIQRLAASGIKTYQFQDSIYDNQLTAICTEPLKAETRHIMRKYQLLS